MNASVSIDGIEAVVTAAKELSGDRVLHLRFPVQR
jgi:hypothetical protein